MRVHIRALTRSFIRSQGSEAKTNLCAAVNADVELSAWPEVAHGVWELRVGDEEGRDASPVQQVKKIVDLWVHDGLANKREGAVANGVCLLQPLCNDTRRAFELPDHVVVVLHCAVDNQQRIVHLPPPLRADRVGVVSVLV